MITFLAVSFFLLKMVAAFFGGGFAIVAAIRNKDAYMNRIFITYLISRRATRIFLFTVGTFGILAGGFFSVAIIRGLMAS